MIESDSKRQAIHSLRGYAYQIWQSLDEWISLSEEELLYLEGAEDIDKLSPGAAETIQVKNLQTGTITLNSEEVISAIAHFWEHKKRNPNIKIIYRFLTTAERGMEKPALFGIKGLDYWDECKHKSADLKPIRDFILLKNSLPDELKQFAKDSQDEVLRAELISCIEWDTGNPNREYLEHLILLKLKKLGSRFGILPSESEKTLPNLLKYVLEKATTADDRSLTFIDLIEQIETQSTVNVPKNAMIQALSVLGGRSIEELIGTQPVASGNIFIDLSQKSIFPTIPNKYSRRESLLKLLRDKILSKKILVLHGSTGMGKSSIGVLLAESLSLQYQWVNLRGNDANSIKAILTNIALNLRAFEDKLLIIDDIPFSADQNIYENSIIALINIVMSKNGYLIITTQNDLPDKASHYIPNISDSVIDVPAMDLSEIKEISELHGCPAEKLNIWSDFIRIKTGGHPQLVHAKIRSLDSASWPAPNLQSLIQPDNFETIKREVKQRLISDFPIEAARTLSYRLSIFSHLFKKQHALIMGEKDPKLNSPGEAFDLLVGPWIERYSSEYYRISPLLKDIAREIWSNSEVKELHAQAVKALLSEETITQIEASNALLHGIMGECGEALMPLIYSLLMDKNNALSKISEDLRWLIYSLIEPGQKIYPKNPIVSLSLRHVQFRVAVELEKDDSALKVALAWEQEIEALTINELKSGSRLLFLMETLLKIEVPFSLQLAMSRIKEVINLLTSENEIYAKGLSKSFSNENPIPFFALFAIARCESFNDLLEFMETLNQEPDEIKDIYLSFLNTNGDWANFLIGKVYLHEYQSSSPNWSDCLAAFAQTIKISLSWKAFSIASNAYHIVAVIYDEHLDNHSKAFETLDEARVHLGDKDPIIENARAMILFRQKRDGEALGILEKILPLWNSDFNITSLQACRRAEISAARLGDWRKAAKMARRGAEDALQKKNEIMNLGFVADQAFALWKTNDKSQSIELFATVVNNFHLLPDSHNNTHSYALQKKIGHALAWLLNDVNANHIDTHPEPPPGCFSDCEANDSIKDYPLQPIDFFWMLLAEIEFALKSDNKIFIFFRERYDSTKYPVVKLSLAKLVIAHSLQKHNLAFLVQNFYDFIIVFDITKKLSKNPSCVFEKVEVYTIKEAEQYNDFLILLLSFAMVILFAEGRAITESNVIWRRDIEKLGLMNSKLSAWLDYLDAIKSKCEFELIQVMTNGSAGTGERFVASLLLAKSVQPENMFYSHLLLFNIASNMHSLWGKEIEEQLEQIIVPIWAEQANSKSFSLLNPKLNRPLILIACNDNSSGFKKIAKVLYATKDAVNVILPSEMLMSVRRFL